MSKNPLFIRVLVLRHGEQWLAQALEFDLAAQGSTGDQAINSFIRILRARVTRDLEMGRIPLVGLPAAPDKFFQQWARLMREHDHLTTEPVTLPDEAPIPEAYVISRIAEYSNEAVQG